MRRARGRTGRIRWGWCGDVRARLPRRLVGRHAPPRAGHPLVGAVSAPAYVEWGMPTGTVAMLVMLGMVRRTDDGLAYQLTEKGNAWLREWCEARLKEHGESPSPA